MGMLDPSSGAIRLKQSPTSRSRPYGIVVNSEGIPFFCEFGTNKLAVISPDTMDITEFELPKGTRPRRLAITADDMVYYTDFAQGRLGRLDPKTKKVEDWPSPGGEDSRPYGIAATADGKVWYSESGLKPNTIVRFDPKTRTFETWPIPSCGGVVRHMVATQDGRSVYRIQRKEQGRHRETALVSMESLRTVFRNRCPVHANVFATLRCL